MAARLGRQPWPSPQVKAALLTEMASLGRLAGAVCQALADIPSPALPAASREALRAAASQFSGIPAAAAPASERDPRSGTGTCCLLFRQVLSPPGSGSGNAKISLTCAFADRARELLPDVNGLTFTYAAISVGTSWNAWRHAASTGGQRHPTGPPGRRGLPLTRLGRPGRVCVQPYPCPVIGE